MKKSKSSKQWLKAHEEDIYVRRAREQGWRSRAAFKLLEIEAKFGLFGPGMRVVDLGAAPGGWSQVAAKLAGPKGSVYALDLLEMAPIPGVTFIQGDFGEDEIYRQLIGLLDGESVDLVISDMAPNLSGMKDIDQPRATWLVELVIECVDRVLRPGGAAIAKCFEGEGIDDIRRAFQARFGRVNNFKPGASKPKSREIYLIGRDHRPDG